MTKSELIKAVAQATGMNKVNATNAVNAVFNTIMGEVANGGKVTLTGFGTFETRSYKQKECVNPRTHEVMTVPAFKYPAFRAGKNFKGEVNK